MDLTFQYVNDLHSSDVSSKDCKWYLKSCCVLQDHYDDEQDKTVFHNITPDLQDQDQYQDQDRFYGLRPVLS